jgi:phosphoribosylformylglycinamidine cyclo-ligase
MRRTFNLGVGLAIALDARCWDAAIDALTAAGETVFPLGQVVAESSNGEPYVEFI